MKLFDEIPYLENEYIIVRKISEEDAGQIEKMCSDPEVTRYIPTYLYELGFKDKKEAIRGMYADQFVNKESLFLGIYKKNQPDIMTGILEFYNYDPNWNKASVGVRLGRDFWRQGIAGNAIRLGMDYLLNKTDVKRITAHVISVNVNSSRIVEALGYRLRKYKVEEDWGFEKPSIVNKYVYEKWGNISYAKIGEGSKNMVILPGLALKSTLGAAEEIAKRFKEFKDYSIYLFDDRNNIGENYTLRERAGDVAAELKTLGIKHAYVYGASMGGMTGQYLAIDHPDLVEKLFLSSTCSKLPPYSESIVKKWIGLAKERKLEELEDDSAKHIYSEKIVEKYGSLFKYGIGEVSDEELDKFVKLSEAALSMDACDELDKIRCQVYVVYSMGDRLLPPECGKKIADKLKCGSYAYGMEYGHAVYYEAADHNKRIFDFFENNRNNLKK